VTDVDAVEDRSTSQWWLLLGAAGVAALFLFSVQLLGAATEAAAPVLRRVFASAVVGEASALGLSWLGAYALANGSVVAALALSLFTVDVVSAPQLFMLVAGSRLGAAAVVVLVGALDYVQEQTQSFREAVSLGLLTFLLTHTIYLPVVGVGALALPYVREPLRSLGLDWTVGGRPLAVFDRFAVSITEFLGPGLSVVLALLALFGSLSLFDRLLDRVDSAAIRRHVFSRFRRVRTSFVAGLVLTSATTSVAFSLGVVVPLYNRGYVRRDELVPYVLGANLGTLVDTLIVAVVLDSPVGAAVVLGLLGVAALVTGAALVFHDAYSRLVGAVDDRLLTDRRAFVLFALSLLAVPAALVVVPLVVR
jgi:sodium-dependent phosphate cotransporter